MTPERESEIIRKVLTGDVNAFEELVKEHEKTVFNIALRTVGVREDAEDITQEAFIRAYNALSSFNGSSRFSTWLYRIVSNLCIDRLRRKKAETVPLTVEDDDGEESETEIPDESFSPEKLLEKKLTRDAVNRGILTLPPESRQILLLREIRGMSYEEIADALSLEPGTVKSRLFRARKKLCAFLIADGNISVPDASENVKGGARDEGL